MQFPSVPYMFVWLQIRIFLTDFYETQKYQISKKSTEWELSWNMWTDRQTYIHMMKLTATFHEYANVPKNLCVMLPHHTCPWGLWLNKAVHHIQLHVCSQCVSRKKCTQQYQHTILHLNHLLNGCTKTFPYTKHCTVSKHISPVEADCRNSQSTRLSLACVEPCQLVAGTGGWYAWGIHPSATWWEPCT
jgi:hypothetical protein